MSMQPATDAPITVHRLQLPRDTRAEDVLAMIQNVRPEASLDGGTIDLGDGSRLVADTGRRGAGRWNLETPRDREDPLPEGMDDTHGYGRAFPQGIPFGVEREALDLVWSLARRLFGAVVTDSGVRIEPHPCHVQDLVVVSAHALAPESFAQMLAPLEPEAMLDEVPELTPRSGYAATVPLDGGGEIRISVGRSVQPVALRAVSWLDQAVDYDISYVPADERETDLERPDAATELRWTEVYRRIGMIAGVILESVGGYVVDREGFLVAPSDLV